MRRTFQLFKHGLFSISFFGLANLANAEELKFGLPVKCELDKDCFIQNLPDVKTDKTASDTFCQGATYDGHKGIDIRLRSLENIKDNIPVVASASGIVKAYRDGEDDKLIVKSEDRDLVKGKECGNGVVISHQDGYETQYCHLKKNSISVQKGERVQQGDIIGFIGNSGLAQFPHVHFTIRKNGQWLDPISGRKPSQTCTPTNTQGTLLNENVIKYFTENTTRLMASGITGNIIAHNELVKTGAPEKIKAPDQSIIGWAWFINLRKGDQIRFVLEGPKGFIVKNTTEPLERHKATYSAYLGKKSTPAKGEYRLTTQLLRNNQPIEESMYVQTIE